MSKETHKYIIGVGFSIEPSAIQNEKLQNKLDGVIVEHDDDTLYKTVDFIPTFTPRIGDGFTIQLD
ncbi:hypothetical protein QYS49_11975 [Marivirga salinae]|uniref:Uncharacterized protein n=1 Tax=Marivirga salinarum TaxID=3059078 RepID=A0AA49JH26_9BACT|nr:hypothetical protein [Marivirga sp. BDSF4-3]WKK77738.1 hypothetical protein QYS49_11975 [Marivirga sp. BDSF4-3]